jgi:C4-dicarboxylate-specific signal transduction histidine kinase
LVAHATRDQNNQLEYIGAIQDVSERWVSEEALTKTRSELAHVSRVVSLGALTASIAHEVNQPLTAIVNNANACLGLLPDSDTQLEEVQSALEEIVEDADRASAVLARVRQLVRKVPYTSTLLNLNDVVAEVLVLARNECAARHVTIVTELEEDLPLVKGDRVQIQQVLLNLVVNGMDAMSSTEESRRTVSIGGSTEVRDNQRVVVIAVRDCGIGLKREEMDRLFEAFYTTKPQGMGMGLAISRSIIEAHGGRLWAESNQGAGAIFLFSLPVAENTPL